MPKLSDFPTTPDDPPVYNNLELVGLYPESAGRKGQLAEYYNEDNHVVVTFRVKSEVDWHYEAEWQLGEDETVTDHVATVLEDGSPTYATVRDKYKP